MLENLLNRILVVVALRGFERGRRRSVVTELSESGDMHVVCFTGEQVGNGVFGTDGVNHSERTR